MSSRDNFWADLSEEQDTFSEWRNDEEEYRNTGEVGNVFTEVPRQRNQPPRYDGSLHGGRGNGNYGGRGYNSRKITNPNAGEPREKPTLSKEAAEAIRRVVNQDSDLLITEMDFKNVASTREHAICFLYTAAVRGQQQYHGSRGDLAKRLEFAGEEYLKQFINDEPFRVNKINKLNATKGSAPSLNE